MPVFRQYIPMALSLVQGIGRWSCLPLQTQLFLCREEATCIYTVFLNMYIYIYIFNAHLVSIQTRKVSSLPYINEIKNTCSQCTLITQVYTFNTLGVFSQHSYKNITKIAQQHKFVECSKKFTLNYIFKLIQSLCLWSQGQFL